MNCSHCDLPSNVGSFVLHCFLCDECERAWRKRADVTQRKALISTLTQLLPCEDAQNGEGCGDDTRRIPFHKEQRLLKDCNELMTEATEESRRVFDWHQKIKKLAVAAADVAENEWSIWDLFCIVSIPDFI